MASLIKVGNAAIVKSSVTLETWKRVTKYRPEALTIVDEDKNPIFKVGVASEATGKINKFGVEWAPTTDDPAGLAVVTVFPVTQTSDPVKHLSDAYGRSLLLINKVEAKIAEITSEIDAEEAEIAGCITIG